MKLKISKNKILAIMIILFPICSLLNGALSYYDEFIGLVGIVYLLFLVLNKKLKHEDKRICVLLFFITMLGVFSNILSGLINQIFPIVIDILWLWKPFSAYLFFKYFIDSSNGSEFENIITPIAKFFVIMCFILSIIGQFVNVGVMSGNLYGGIKKFGFFWKNGIQTGWLLFGSILIISLERTKHFLRYLLMALVPMLLTGSSLVLCWVIVELFLILFFRQKTKFKIGYLLILAAGVIIFAWADFSKYLFSESIRSTLLKYGAITANSYFPFGSGFATYGSDMAQRYYSNLYIKYGWKDTWGFGQKSTFLNDIFFAGIIGQFGWFGFLAYLLVLYLLLKNGNSNKLNKNSRCTYIATVITIAVVMIGSASAKSMMGVCTFSILGIVSSYKNEFRKENNE